MQLVDLVTSLDKYLPRQKPINFVPVLLILFLKVASLQLLTVFRSLINHVDVNDSQLYIFICIIASNNDVFMILDGSANDLFVQLLR